MISEIAWFLEAVATRNSQDAIGPAEPAARDFDAAPRQRGATAEAMAVVRFWQDAGPALWFAKDPEFDRRFRERFAAAHEAAARGELKAWIASPYGALGIAAVARPVSAQRLSRHAAHVRHRRPGARDRQARQSPPAMTERCRPTSGFSSICRSAIPKIWPTRIARLRSASRLGEPHVAHAERPSRHRQALRAVPASQRDPGTDNHAGRATLPRRGRVRGIARPRWHTGRWRQAMERQPREP